MNHTSSASIVYVGTAVATSVASLMANAITPIEGTILPAGFAIIELESDQATFPVSESGSISEE